ncbi:PIR protein CIR protein [Plasmodium vinckei petteri]|uniref:PIR protein CIR protein n=1 Tax=Plasmodium vinckei petteri TaxID=138298 RepID=A0A6V7SML3_PLAVN|nr:PIR protein CIR protein [Plasmodium vinckei petteri]
MDDKVCDFLLEVDEYFNKGIVDERKFNNFTKFHSYCPYENNSNEPKCTTNNDRISALGAYLHNKINEIDENYKKKKGISRHIEVFMMWLGEKLFRIDKDYKATLEESYEKNLEKSMGNLNYWKAIDSKKIYKKATIKKMSEYYSLLNYICKLITEYNKNEQNPSRKTIGNYASQCDNFYKTIHNSINGCKPYIQLLDDLKMIYEIFRLQRVDIQSKLNDRDKKLLLNRVKSLTTFKKENRYFMTVNAILSFDDKECVEVKSNDEKIGEQIALQKSKTPTRGAQTRVSGNAQRGNIGSRKPGSSQPKRPPAKQIPSPPPAKPTPPLAPSQKDNKLKTSQTGQTHQNGLGGTANGAGDGKGDPGGGKGGSGGGKGGSGGGAGGGKGDAGSGVNGGGSVQGDQGKSSGGTGSGPGGQGKLSGGAGSGPGGQGKLSGGAGSGPGSGPGSHVDKGSQGGSGNQVNTDSQTKLSGNLPQGNPVPTQPASVPSGAGTLQSAGTIPPTSAPTSSSQTVQSPTGSQSPSVSQSSSVSQSPPVPPPSAPSTPQSSTPKVPTSQDPAALPQPQPQPQPQPDQKPQVQQQDPPPVPPPQTGGSSSPNEPKDSDNTKGNKNGASDNTGGTGSGSKDPGGKSSDPASNTSGGSFNLGSSLFGSLFNGVDKFNKASKFFKENHQKFKDAKDKISDAYNNTVDNLKSVYHASSDYFNSVISNISNQLTQVDPPKSDGNPSGSGNPSGGGNSHNQLQPPQPPSTTDPTDPSNPPTPPTPTKDPAPTTPPTTPINPTSQKQSSPQPQPITPQPPQADPFTHKTAGKAIAQLVKSISSNPNLKKTWNIFPTTWNGSGDCKPEIKFINTTLVCCTSEQCSLTGILITLVLIPIILSIAYKYLSFGSSKKSEKKNMKRVINFHDGNRKTKIIISSNNRNKNLKPVINLVGGKKDSLINIYKIIQADPMPFINLFFLLIFFVYKRKRDTIE